MDNNKHEQQNSPKEISWEDLRLVSGGAEGTAPDSNGGATTSEGGGGGRTWG